MKLQELREMNAAQLTELLKETTADLFRLRVQSATEKLDAPSELRRHRRLIARINTLLRQQELAAAGK